MANTKLFDTNDFMVSGRPGYYKEGPFGLKIGIEIPNAPKGKYAWFDVSYIGKDKKPAFTEDQFKAAKNITLLSYKMDSYKDKQGSTRYTARANGQNALLDVDLGMNIGKIGGVIKLVNEQLGMIVIQVPYMGRDGSGENAKSIVKHRDAMIKWPEGQPLPAVDEEIFVLGKLAMTSQGDIYIEAGSVCRV